MEFRTVAEMPKYDFTISHRERGLMVGSCFAVSIGERMIRYKMPVTVNPFGVVYNPLSIIRTLSVLEQGELFDEQQLVYGQDLWHSFAHHGSFSAPDKYETLHRINFAIRQGHDALTDADYLILTMGTAWVYERIASGQIVSNCHKFPASDFRRFRLSAENIVAAFDLLLARGPYKRKKILLNVSPVRHLKDGAAANQLSKATLIVAAHQLVEKYDHVHYFPSYELLMDDLRDYRFYEPDMVHPSSMAVDYVWQRFGEALIDESSHKLFRRIDKIISARNHRPFNAESRQYQEFKTAVVREIDRIVKECPHLDFTQELNFFSK